MQFHRLDPRRDRTRLREFLRDSDPEDYLLEDLDEWARSGRLWAGTANGTWLAFGRLHDLGDDEGWVSGVRVAAARRGQGLGGELLDHILADARSVGLRSVRAAIEEENVASSHLFVRAGFQPVLELTLRCGSPHRGRGSRLRKVSPGTRWSGRPGWLPAATGYVDVMPGEDGGRIGRWRPKLAERWANEGKLYRAPGLAVAVQQDWWASPRTLWVNPLRGNVASLVSAVGALTYELGHEQWQAFLPSSRTARSRYERLGLVPSPAWGDRVRIFERNEPSTNLGETGP